MGVMGILGVAAGMWLEVQAQMNLPALKALPECELSEAAKLSELFPRVRGGTGGSGLKWSSAIEAVVIYPGEVGHPDGSGGRGASPGFNIPARAVIAARGTEDGIELLIPGFRGFLPWTLIDDLSAKHHVSK